MNLKTFTLILTTDKHVKESAEKLRGYIGNKFLEYPILHHHAREKYVYSYPLVQYKILEGTPIIIGLEEGAETLKEIYGEINRLLLGKSTYKVIEKQTFEKDQEFDLAEDMQQYKFLTPWLALNEKNYKEYKKLNGRNKVMLLHKVLIGNILSISKSLEYVVLDEIKVKTNVQPVKTLSKAIPLVGFTGEFQVNFHIPSLLGIGKSVSRGFGTVKKSSTNE